MALMIGGELIGELTQMNPPKRDDSEGPVQRSEFRLLRS
jgi:hypothetical protein